MAALPIEIGQPILNYFVLLPSEVQYKFLRRGFKPNVNYYTQDTTAKYVYMNPNLVSKVILNAGVFNNGKQDSDIHIIEFSEPNGKVSIFNIDDKGLAILGGKNPNSGGDTALEPAK